MSRLNSSLTQAAINRQLDSSLCFLCEFLFRLFRKDLAECKSFAVGVNFDRAFLGDAALDEGFGEFVFDVFLEGAF